MTNFHLYPILKLEKKPNQTNQNHPAKQQQQNKETFNPLSNFAMINVILKVFLLGLIHQNFLTELKLHV